MSPFKGIPQCREGSYVFALAADGNDAPTLPSRPLQSPSQGLADGGDNAMKVTDSLILPAERKAAISIPSVHALQGHIDLAFTSFLLPSRNESLA